MPTARLSRDLVVAGALALMAEDGIDGVSLRRLADRLGVRAPSLYHHVRTKEDLHGAMSASVFLACLQAVPNAPDWQTWLRDFGSELWRAQHALRDATRLFLLAIPDAETVDRLRGMIAARLLPYGIEPARAIRLQHAVQGLIIGCTLFERQARNPPCASAESTALESLDALIAGFDAASS